MHLAIATFEEENTKLTPTRWISEQKKNSLAYFIFRRGRKKWLKIFYAALLVTLQESHFEKVDTKCKPF